MLVYKPEMCGQDHSGPLSLLYRISRSRGLDNVFSTLAMAYPVNQNDSKSWIKAHFGVFPTATRIKGDLV